MVHKPVEKKYEPKKKFGINILDCERIKSKPILKFNKDIFVDVTFDADSKRYSYFLGDVQNLQIGDFVAVFAHDKKDGNKIKLKIVRVEYISDVGEFSIYANSPIVAKANSEIVSIPKSKVFHYAWCHELKKSPGLVIYFETENDAIQKGLRPCSKCHKW